MKTLLSFFLGASCLLFLAACGGGSGGSGASFSASNTADTQAPTPPSNFMVKRKTSSQITLAWGASTDNLAVTGYELVRDGQLIGHLSPDAREYLDANLPENSIHDYQLRAVDAAGNLSQIVYLSAQTSALEGGVSSSAATSQASLSLSSDSRSSSGESSLSTSRASSAASTSLSSVVSQSESSASTVSLSSSSLASSSLLSSSVATSASVSSVAKSASSSSLVASSSVSSSSVSSKAGSSSVSSSVKSSSSSSIVSSSSQASAARAVENPIVETAWTYCSPLYFGGCSFEGLREVRLGVGNKWVIKRYLNGMDGSECNPDVFGEDPAPSEEKHCEYGNVIISGTLPMPSVCHMNEMCPEIDLTAIPIGSKGLGTLRIKATDDFGAPDPGGVGAFRTVCSYSHMAFDDPIVYPGQPGASHLHAFFGNTGANAYSTADSLANKGNSTCLGGIANRSAYWVPALINMSTGKPVVPDDPIWYYKTGYGGVLPAQVQAMPAGLRMIAGDMNATGAQDMVHWDCFETGSSHGASIPNCNLGEHVVMSVRFPQCWDGKHLDSADHKSHMAYPTGKGCPASHPNPIPEITLNVKYLVREQEEPTHWRLSSDKLKLPAGYSAHADWFDGWNNDVRNAWIKNCDQASKDCHAHLLGDGRMLY